VRPSPESGAPEARQQRRAFLWDTLQLGSGTALAQALLMASMPVLSRIYNPDDFGVMALFLSLVTVISIISGLRYDAAVLLPEEDADGFDLLRLHLLLTLGVSVLTGAVLWGARLPLSRWLNAPSLAGYLWLAGPGIFVLGALNVLISWHTRRKRFGLLATTRLGGSVATVGTQIGVGLAGLLSPAGLIGGALLGRAVEGGLQAGGAVADLRRGGWPRPGRARLMALAGRFRKFPLFNTWAMLVNTLSWNVPAFLLASFFSPEVVGLYALGDRAIRAPMNFIGRAIGQVFLQRGVAAHRDGTLGQLFLDTLQMLARAVLLPTIVLLLLGREIFTLIFGAQWAEAGVYTQILGLWAFVWFVSSPVANIIMITENQEKGLLFNVILLATRILSFAGGGLLGNPRWALGFFSVSGAAAYGGLLIWLGRVSGVAWPRTLRALLGGHFLVALAAVVVLGAAKLAHLPPAGTVGLAGLVLILYYAHLLRRNRHLLRLR
jgi:lipopolysaccharide exporter